MPLSPRTRKQLRSGIYCWLNNVNGKVYVGQTKSFDKRKLCHLSGLRLGKSRNKHLQASFNKYGEEAFEFIELWPCPLEELTDWEQWWMDKLHATDKRYGYNRRPSVDSNIGLTWTVSDTTNLVAASRRTAAQRSVSQKKTMANPTVKALHKAATIEAMSRPDRRKKASDGAKKLWAENRDKMVEIQRAKRSNPIIAENMRRGNLARRKLSDEQVTQIIQEYRKGSSEHGMRALGQKHGVTRAVIFHIIHNEGTYQREEIDNGK